MGLILIVVIMFAPMGFVGFLRWSSAKMVPAACGKSQTGEGFMNILETKELYHDFGGLEVLFGVNLQVKEGERHAVIGPERRRQDDALQRHHRDVQAEPGPGVLPGKGHDRKPGRHEMARLGMGRSFQITSTFNRLTAFQNYPPGHPFQEGDPFSTCSARWTRCTTSREETDEVLKRINLDRERDMPAGVLSYGKHRALEISLALATDPDLVMLDEPTAGMSRDETHHAVGADPTLTEGKTMVIIEHDMDVVFSLADRITVLHYGQILATGAPCEIRQNQAVKDAYLGDLEVSHSDLTRGI